MSDSYSILRIKRKRTAPTQLDALGASLLSLSFLSPSSPNNVQSSTLPRPSSAGVTFNQTLLLLPQRTEVHSSSLAARNDRSSLPPGRHLSVRGDGLSRLVRHRQQDAPAEGLLGSLSSYASADRRPQDRITAFLAHPPPALSRVSSSSHLATPTPPPSSPSRKLPASLRAARLAASTSTDGSTSPKERSRDERVSGYLAQAKRARYRIVERGRESWGGGLQEARPPEVV